MVYYFSKTIEGDVQGVASQVRAALKKYGFGVISEIDIQKTFKEGKGSLCVLKGVDLTLEKNQNETKQF